MPENKSLNSVETRAEEPVVQPAVEQVPEPYEDAQGVDLEKGPQKRSDLGLVHVQSHVSAHDIPHVPYYESGDEVYERFSHFKKICIVSVLAFCSFLAPMASTTVLAAVPEVASTYNTNGTIINVSNAIYMLFMGLSPMFWGPIGQVYGRRWTQLLSAILFTAFSIGTALAPNLASFFIFRVLTAFQGTSFLIIGSSCIGDIYRPTERATALSWFFSGTLIGPGNYSLLSLLLDDTSSDISLSPRSATGWNHRHLQELARYLLASDRSCRFRIHPLLFLPSRDYPLQEISRASRPHQG